MDLNGFDADAVEPAKEFQPLPAGWYRCVITESVETVTKAQTGSYLKLTLEVIEGEYQGRKLFDRLNLNNPNATAVQVAQAQLSGICRAVGVTKPRSSHDLHDKPLMAKVAVKAATGEFGASNEIKEYAPVEKGAAPAAAKSGGATPPWKRKAG